MAATTRDKHYRAIVDALERQEIDGHLFEACICELLAERIPGLAPVPGGKDAGFDGAIADLSGEAYPLVSTTGEASVRNLKKSLDSYRKSGGPRNRVVFVTSRRLTAQERKKLVEAARDLGFELVQVYEQRAVAALLYRSSRWCRQLLDVTSTAPVLSVLPSRGLVTELPLLGREDDLKWLDETPGDRILLATSGLGKTYLLYWMATRKEKGIFIATRDRNELAAAIRDEKPELLFLDDNGFDSNWLEEILALRQLAHFDLVVTGWPHREDSLRSALGPKAKIRQLEGLRRSDILEILGHLGVRDDTLQGHLADQAINRPGLAVTVAQLALSESWRDAVDGKAVLRELRQAIERVLGEHGQEAIQLLSVLALGGAAGVERKKAATSLGLLDPKAAGLLRQIETTGIVVQTSAGSQPLTLAVEPGLLRIALIAQTFFDGPGSLDYQETADGLEGLEPLQGILGAALLGARVDRRLLFEELTSRCPVPNENPSQEQDDLLFFFGDPNRAANAWMDFAKLGMAESRLVLTKYPAQRLHEVASPLLDWIPEETISRLLDLVDGDPSTAESNLGPIHGWLATIQNPPEAIEKRCLLVSILEQRQAQAPAGKVELQACLAAISPRLGSRRVMASRDKIRIFEGTVLAYEEWEELRGLLRRVLDLLLHREGLFPWSELGFAFNSYRWPEPRNNTTQGRGFELVRYALEYLSERARQSVGQRLAWIRLALNYDLDADQISATRQGCEDELAEAEVLFPTLAKFGAELPAEWLERWAAGEPVAVLERWRALVPQVRILLPNLYSNLGRVAHALAPLVKDPEPWIEGLVELEIHEKGLRPFLDRLDDDALPRQMSKLFTLDPYRWSAALEIARRGAPPDLIQQALTELERDLPRLREEVRYTEELARPLAEKYLAGDSSLAWLLASAIATNHHFDGNPLQQQARRILLAKPAIAQMPIAVWAGLCSDLGRDPDFAADWLIAVSHLPQGPRLAASSDWFSFDREISDLIATGLGKVQCTKILQEANPTFVAVFAVSLVGNDSDLYRLLARAGVKPERLQLPLQGFRPGPDWVPFAEAASAAGLSATTIAEASILHGMWGGSPEEIRGWIEELKKIEAERPQLLELAREALALAEVRLQQAIEQKKRIDMKGLVA